MLCLDGCDQLDTSSPANLKFDPSFCISVTACLPKVPENNVLGGGRTTGKHHPMLVQRIHGERSDEAIAVPRFSFPNRFQMYCTALVHSNPKMHWLMRYLRTVQTSSRSRTESCDA